MSSSSDQAAHQANQDPLIGEPVIWHRNYPPPEHAPEHSIVSIWLIARHLWQGHHDGEDGYCLARHVPREPSPCPDQVLAQHVMIQAIIMGNGPQSLEMVRTLAREADAWRFIGEPRPETYTGLNVISARHISEPR